MTTQTQLGVVSIDDTMDTALSPFQPVEDFDLDFDHMEEPNQPQPDDAMAEHDEHEYGADDKMVEEELDVLGDDDMLEDDREDHNNQDHQLDVEVSDQPNQQQEEQIMEDEEILYDDEDEDQHIAEQTTTTTEAGAIRLDRKPPEHNFSEQHPDPADEVATHENTGVDTDNAYTHDKDDRPEQALPEPTTTDTSNENSYNPESKETEEPDLLYNEQVPAQNNASVHASIPGESDADNAPVTTDFAADHEPVTSGHNQQLLDLAAIEDSAVDAALHSIRLFWNNEEWRLFSWQHDAPDCFFHSTELAYEPMDKLLEACRGVIPPNELDHHDELTFVVEELGLNICEDSKYAPSLTLAHIVELYLTLHRNGTQDTVTVIPCSLQSRTCLQTYYGRLLQDAMSGRNLSEVVGDLIESPDDEVEGGDNAAPDPQEEPLNGQANVKRNVENVDSVAQEAQPATNPPKEADEGVAEPRGTDEVTEPAPVNPEENVGGEGGAHEEVDDDENDLLDVFDDEVEDEGNPLPEEHVETKDFVGNTSFSLDPDPVDGTEQHETGIIADEKSTIGSTTGEEVHDIIEQPFAADDDPDYEDPGAPAPVGDDFYNSEDEMLRLRQEEFRRASVEAPVLTPQISFDIADGNQEMPSEGQDVINHEPEEEFDVVSMPPETPQKGSDKKRKAFDEEDEFELSGFDTPEPKRRRPS